MKLFLLNTEQGLKPMYDEDYEEKRKLKKGVVYRAEVKLARNIDHHRKYFSLINTAWAYQTEKRMSFFNNSSESFRKTIEVAAGHFEQIYSIERKEWVQIPKSIAFDKMSQDEFETLYERVKDVLFSVFLTHISEDEFLKNLSNY